MCTRACMCLCMCVQVYLCISECIWEPENNPGYFSGMALLFCFLLLLENLVLACNSLHRLDWLLSQAPGVFLTLSPTAGVPRVHHEVWLSFHLDSNTELRSSCLQGKQCTDRFISPGLQLILIWFVSLYEPYLIFGHLSS